MTEPCNYHKPHQSLFNEAKYYLLVVCTSNFTVSFTVELDQLMLFICFLCYKLHN